MFNDPPYRVRRQIVGALTPHVLNSMEPAVVSLVDALLDRMEEQRHFDLIRDFAAAIPVEVIGNLLRVPREDRAPLRDWSLAILGALELVLTPNQHMAGNRAVREFGDYLRILVAERLRHPGDEQDMLTRLLGAGQMTETELLHNCIFLLNAGHETTTNLIGNRLHAPITHQGTLSGLPFSTCSMLSTAEIPYPGRAPQGECVCQPGVEYALRNLATPVGVTRYTKFLAEDVIDDFVEEMRLQAIIDKAEGKKRELLSCAPAAKRTEKFCWPYRRQPSRHAIKSARGCAAILWKRAGRGSPCAGCWASPSC